MVYTGNDGDKNNGSMAHFHDLREIYAKQMEYHGCGFGLFQPISARDMTPPCAGYFDRNGDWNLICNLSTAPQAQKPLHTFGDAPAQPYAPLKYDPTPTSSLNIEWQPKTSQNVEAHVLNGGGQTPDNLPAGADVSIKYASKSKFGAVLMTLRPITLTAYNDERLFMDWLNSNRALLFQTYGAELKKYGMWVVTRTFSAPGCSINAWQDNSKQSVVSLKAKASMLGELADGEMQWNDKMTDKDWSHYKANDGDGVVVFMDGIEVNKSEWWIEGVRQKLRSSPPRSHSNSPVRPLYYDPSTVMPAQVGNSLDVQRRRSTPGQINNGGCLPPQVPDNRYSYYGNGIPTAQADVGVMPTWSENTAGPNTHGGTQNIMPRNDGSGGYLISQPAQAQQAARTNSGFASLFTKMGTPQPWEGIESPLVSNKPPPAAAAAAAAAAAVVPAPAPAPAAVSAPALPTAPTAPATPPTQAASHQGDDSPITEPTPATPPQDRGVLVPAWKVDEGWMVAFNDGADEETLKDAGVAQFNRRSLSVRRLSTCSTNRPASVAPSMAESIRSTNSIGRSQSLRRETRSISGDSIAAAKRAGLDYATQVVQEMQHARSMSQN